MSTLLNSQGIIPLTQPYNVLPWNYSGTESVTNTPADVVDWVLLELRSEIDASLILSRQAAFLKSNGMIVDTDGLSQVNFSGMNSGNYYVVVNHRNHLPIMSSVPLELSSIDAELYDFSTAQSKAYGINAMKNMGDGNFAMMAGDINADGNIDYANDLLIHWLPLFGFNGYYSEDINLNGDVDYSDDLLIYWLPNFGFSSQVPGGSLARPLKIQNEELKDILIRKQYNEANTE